MMGAKWDSLSFESARSLGKNKKLDGLQPRTLLFSLMGFIGQVCLHFNKPHEERHRVAEDLGAALNTLVLLAEQVNIDLPRSVQLKLQLNSRKYPASLVQGKADKYDSYRATTGFGKGSKQVTTEGAGGSEHLTAMAGKKWKEYEIEDLRAELVEFAKQRNWEQFHTPRNICLALCGEAGELCELFQFKSETECRAGLPGWTTSDRDKVSQELSDVCIYLVRLSDLLNVNLSAVLLKKDSAWGDSSREYGGRPTYLGGYWWHTGCFLVGLAAILFARRKQ